MRIGILGGGLQGCCAALALADRGARVTLFDRNHALITKAGAANEGKIHLGYMYAGDESLRTAKTMMTGALAFESFLRRYLASPAEALATSMPAAYVIHRDAQQPPEQIGHYFNTVHEMLAEMAGTGPSTYFGMDLNKHLHRWSPAERKAAFNTDLALEAYQTPEVAINPLQLAEGLRECISNHPRIELRLGCEIVDVAEAPGFLKVMGRDQDGGVEEQFDHVVNALWDGRIKLDKSFGMPNNRAWIHRLKYGVGFRLPKGAEIPQSATIVLGPFGEVVSYGEGVTYLTWYPTCLREISRETAPPDWANFPPEPLRSEILSGTLGALAEIVPALRGYQPEDLSETVVKGGVIVAWGETDIYDRHSELHQRYEIGIKSKGKFHSIDPGKLTMAPYFAEQCADRIFDNR